MLVIKGVRHGNIQDRNDKGFVAELSNWFTKSTNINVLKAESSRWVLLNVLAQTDFESEPVAVHKID